MVTTIGVFECWGDCKVCYWNSNNSKKECFICKKNKITKESKKYQDESCQVHETRICDSCFEEIDKSNEKTKIYIVGKNLNEYSSVEEWQSQAKFFFDLKKAKDYSQEMKRKHDDHYGWSVYVVESGEFDE